MASRATTVRAVAAALILIAPTTVSAQALFVDAENAFPGQGCGGDGCWTNYLRLTDLDGDGDLDAIFPNAGGFFAAPVAQPLEIWRNGGAGDFSLVTEELLGGPVVAAIRVVAVGDVDGDGDRDMIAPSAAGTADRVWIQLGNGTFAEEGADRLGTSSRSAAVRLLDVDADGDLDLVIGLGYVAPDSPPARLYLNAGPGSFTESPGALPATGPGDDPDDLDAFDADGDFDLDLLVNFHTGANALWLNDGVGNFSDASDRLPPPQGEAFHYGPTACDIDGDGDRDILVDNIGPGYDEQVLINDGTGAFTDESGRLQGNDDGDDDNGVVCLDHDQDGDFDVLIPSLSSPGERLFANGGGGTFSPVVGAFSPLGDTTLWMEVGDVDGDGRLDAITAQGEGDEAERLYLGSDELAVDRSPPVIFAWNTSSFWPEVRFALRDGSTSDEGPRVTSVQAEIANARAPFPASPMGDDLWRVVVPEDTTEMSLCATDLAGNRGCIEVQHGAGTGGGGPAGPTATASAATGATISAGGVTTGGPEGAGGGDGDGGGDGGGDGDRVIERGCGCEVAGGRSRGDAARLLAVAAAALVAARRLCRASAVRRERG